MRINTVHSGPASEVTFTASNYAHIVAKLDSDDADPHYEIGGYLFDAQACREAVEFFMTLADELEG